MVVNKDGILSKPGSASQSHLHPFLCTYWGPEELLRERLRRAEFHHGVFLEITWWFLYPSIIHHLAKIISCFPCQRVDVHLQMTALIAPDDVHMGIKNPNTSLQMIWRDTNQTESSSIEIIWLTGRQISVTRDYVVDISASTKRCTKLPWMKQIGDENVFQEHIISKGVILLPSLSKERKICQENCWDFNFGEEWGCRNLLMTGNLDPRGCQDQASISSSYQKTTSLMPATLTSKLVAAATTIATPPAASENAAGLVHWKTQNCNTIAVTSSYSHINMLKILDVKWNQI